MPRSRDQEKPTRRTLLRGGAALAAGSLAACQATDRKAASARAEDSLSGLADQRGSVPPIAAAERAARRKRLGDLLAGRGLDAMLIEGGSTMTYLAGVSWGRSERFFGLVVLADGAHFWICPAFEESRARQQIDKTKSEPSREAGPGGTVVAWKEDEYPYRPLADELARRGATRLAIEPTLRNVFAERLAAEIGRSRIEGPAGAEIVAALRSRKDAHEISILRRANELTQLPTRTA